MGINKVELGDEVLMDISDSSVTPETLKDGETAYDASGNKIVGTMLPDSAPGEYVPIDLREYRRAIDHNGNLTLIEKAADLGDSQVTKTHQFAVRDCELHKRFDFSGADHSVFGNIRIWGDGQLYGAVKSGNWLGANKFSNIISAGKFPFVLNGDDITDTYLTDSTFERFANALRVKSPFLKISNSYFGDNLTTEPGPQSVLKVEGTSNVDFDRCTIGIGCTNQATFCVDFSESAGSIVRLRDCQLSISNQNVSEGKYGAIGNPGPNDKMIIDRCEFGVFPKRVNDHHSVAPFILANHKQVYSDDPFKSYIIGGTLKDIYSFAPDYATKTISIDDTAAGKAVVNPFGGHIIKFRQYGFYCYYAVPDNLVGSTMYIHAYLGGYINTRDSAPPSIDYNDSDCLESGTGKVEFADGVNMDRAPLLNIIQFTPSKREGRISVYVNNPSGSSAPDAEVRLAGMFLVEACHKNMICDYSEYSSQTLSYKIPTSSPAKFNFVKAVDPVQAGCYGWMFDGEAWTPTSDYITKGNLDDMNATITALSKRISDLEAAALGGK